jgi:transcriptional regulator with XRE-family HTH domain
LKTGEYGQSREILKDVGSRVRQARLKKQLSQEALADQAGLDRTYIGAVERGERNITILSLLKIARALGTKANSLIGN